MNIELISITGRISRYRVTPLEATAFDTAFYSGTRGSLVMLDGHKECQCSSSRYVPPFSGRLSSPGQSLDHDLLLFDLHSLCYSGPLRPSLLEHVVRIMKPSIVYPKFLFYQGSARRGPRRQLERHSTYGMFFRSNVHVSGHSWYQPICQLCSSAFFPADAHIDFI